MPTIRRTRAATRASTTAAHLGSKRAVSADTGDAGPRRIRPGEFEQYSLETSARNSGDFGTVCDDGGSSKEIQRRVQAGAAAWRRVKALYGTEN